MNQDESAKSNESFDLINGVSPVDFYAQVAGDLYRKKDFRHALPMLLIAFEFLTDEVSNEDCDNKESVVKSVALCLKSAWQIAFDNDSLGLCDYIYSELMEPYKNQIDTYDEMAKDMAEKVYVGVNAQGISDLKQFAQLLTPDSGDTPALDEVIASVLSKSDEKVPSKHGKDKKHKGSTAPTSKAKKEQKAYEEFLAQIPNYQEIHGFDEPISAMKKLGFKVADNSEDANFINKLNAYHGISGPKMTSNYLFRSDLRDDARMFMLSTFREVGRKAVRFFVEQDISGNLELKMNVSSMKPSGPVNLVEVLFEESGVLILEDIDMWSHLLDVPFSPTPNPLQMHRARNLTEVLNLIERALNDPEIFVLASASADCSNFFVVEDLEIFFEIVDIASPTHAEKADLFDWLISKYPSLAHIDVKRLTSLESTLSRCEIRNIAGDIVDDAYKYSFANKRVQEITTNDFLMKFSGVFIPESDEFKSISAEVVEDFMDDISSLEDFINKNNG